MDPYGNPYGGVAYNSHKVFLVSSPLEYRYTKILKFFLRLVSGWPGKELDEERLRIEGTPLAVYNTTVTSILLTMQLMYLLENGSRLTFFEMGHMCLVVLMNILVLSRGTLCLSQKYRNLTTKFFREMHVFYYQDKSDYSRKVYLQVHKICHYYTYFIISIMMIAVFLFNGMPTVMSYKAGTFNGFKDPINGTFKLSLYTKIPYMDPERTFNGFAVAFCLNCYIVFLGGCAIMFYNLLLAIMIFHLWGHFKVLIYELDTYPRPERIANENVIATSKGDMFSSAEQVTIAKKLKESIIYHRLIKNFVDEMSDVFGTVLLFFYAFHQISGCLFLLEICQGDRDAVAFYLPLALWLVSELILISVIFETIDSMSEKLRDMAYCLPWEYMNTKNRKTVLLFMIIVQEPIHVKAGGVVSVGVTTMAAILRTSFSYFTILRTMSNK